MGGEAAGLFRGKSLRHVWGCNDSLGQMGLGATIPTWESRLVVHIEEREGVHSGGATHGSHDDGDEMETCGSVLKTCTIS